MARQSNAQAMAALRAQLKEWMHTTATGLTVSSVQVAIPEFTTGRTLAEVRIALNDCIQLTGMRILNGANGPFLSYPQRTVNSKGEEDQLGEYKSMYYPFSVALRDQLEDAALTAYNELLTKVSGK